MRRRIINNVKCYHNCFTEEFFNSKESEELLSWCHPKDRDFLKLKLKKEREDEIL